MEDLIAHLSLGNPQLPVNTPRLERVSITRSSLAPLSLVHPLIVSPFLAPANLWHMMHAKSDAVGMTQQVAPLLDCLRATAVEHQQGISSLTSVDLDDSTMAHWKVIRTCLVPLLPRLQPPIQQILRQQPFQLQALVPPTALASQAVTPA